MPFPHLINALTLPGRTIANCPGNSRFRISCLIWALTICLFALPSAADWDGGIEGGTVLDEDGTSTRLRLKLANDDRPLSHYVYLDWIRSSAGDNSYEAGYTPRYWITSQLYGFGEARLRVDKPLSIERERLLLAGIGTQLVQTAEQSLKLELAAGQRTTEFEGQPETDSNLAVARLGYIQVLAELLRLELDLNADFSDEFNESRAEAGISYRVPGGAIKYSYRIRRIDSDGADTVEDKTSFVSFTYGF